MKKISILLLIITSFSCNPIPKTKILLGFELGMTRAKYNEHKNFLSHKTQLTLNDKKDEHFLYTYELDKGVNSDVGIDVKKFEFIFKPSFKKIKGTDYLIGLHGSVYALATGINMSNALCDLIDKGGYEKITCSFEGVGKFKDYYISRWTDKDCFVTLFIEKGSIENIFNEVPTPFKTGELLYESKSLVGEKENPF